MKACFLIIPCENVYNKIPIRSFLEAINAVASTTHLNMKYHKIRSESVVIVVAYVELAS